MKRKVIISLIVIIIGLLSTSAVIYLQHQAPDYNANLVLKGLKGKVSVKWDDEGIPHIEASDSNDVYRVLGYVMAQERLFQMDIYRRAAAGTLSEILGKPGLGIDKTSRLMQFRSVFEKRRESGEINPKTLQYLDSFFAGVNEFISKGDLPWEYTLLGVKPPPFEVEDAYAFVGLMSYQFSPAPKRDFVFSKLKEKFEPWQWQEFRYLRSTTAMVKNIPFLPNHKPQQMSLISKTDSSRDYLAMDDIIYFEGSNGWLLDASRSRSGKPILANDPHIGFSLPGIWYEAHIKSSEMEVYGHFLPIIPFAVIAHNETHGWGVTLSYVDDLDYFKEKIDWSQKKYREADGTWQELEEVVEPIKVKGESDLKFVFYKTKRGPVLNEFKELRDISKVKDTSIRWVWDHPLNEPMQGLMEINYAQSSKEFLDALKYVKAPGLNLLYASAKESIIFKVVAGGVPLRNQNVDSSLVLDSQIKEHVYYEQYPHEQVRFLWEYPEDGIIVSGNDRSPNYPSWFKGYWQPNDRYTAMYQNLKKQDKWSIEELEAVQTNLQSPVAVPMVKSLLSDLMFENSKMEAATLLSQWDGTFHEDSAEPLIFIHWTQAILKKIFWNYLEEDDYYRLSFIAHSWKFLKKITQNQLSEQWFDDPATKEKESRIQVLNVTFQEVITNLSQKYGKDPSKWKWGSEHTIEFNHSFSKIPVIGQMMRLGPFPVRGGYNVTNNFRRLGDDDGLKVKGGPSTRRLIDFANPRESLGIIPIGNSGNPKSPFFSNQMQRFLNSEYRKQRLDVAKHTYAEQVFTPEK